MKLFCINILLLITTFFYGQNQTDIEFYCKKYPNDNIVSLKNDIVIDINIVNNQIQIKQSSIDEHIYLNETASLFSNHSVGFSTFNELKKIEAFSYEWSGKKYKEIKVKDYKIKDELDNVFHDDFKTINFIYPKLAKGSKTKVTTEENITNPRFLKPFFLGGAHPYQNSKITINVDKNINLVFKNFNTQSVNLNFKKEEKKNKIIYHWEAENVSSIKHESQTPNYRNYYPHIFPIITDYQVGDKKINIATGINDLYQWYYSLVKDINKEPTDPALIELVNEITKGKNSETEKVKALYYWVQKNIKYIAFEYALGGFIPRNVNDIFQKKYGDCKDNSNILNEMLTIAGIKGYLTWVGTRDIPYKYDELQTPSVDNHMILTYKNDDKYYFLDATGRYLPMDLPSGFIQGKEVLIGKNETEYEIIKVPVVAPEINSIKDISSININNNIITGISNIELNGYPKIDFFHHLEGIENQIKLTEFYKNNLEKGNNKFSISDIVEQNKFEYDTPFKIQFNYIIQDYIKINGNELYINLNLYKVLSENKLKENRETDVEVENQKLIHNEYNLTIPEGYKIKYVPSNVKIENELLDIYINYEVLKDKIKYTQTIKYKFLELKKDQFKRYNETVKKGELAYKELVILEKNIK